MPRRRSRIVALENAARSATGLPLLGRAHRLSVSDTLAVSDNVTVSLSGMSIGSSESFGSITVTRAYRRMMGESVRARFQWDATTMGVGVLVGSMLWEVFQQQGVVGGVVGGVIGFAYGVHLWQRTEE